MFNPVPQVHLVDLSATREPEAVAVVLDDFLLEPHALVNAAVDHRQAFAPPTGNAFPGPELPLPEVWMDAWCEVLCRHAADALGVDALGDASGRLSLVTTPPERLSPVQRLCHRDRLGTGLGERPLASVVYLFDRPGLGGTSFYRRRRSAEATEDFMRQVPTMSHDDLTAALGTAPGYLGEGNPWFERVAVVPPRFNRAIFYAGDLFHSSEVPDPSALRDDPATGRLTLNGFFVARRRAPTR
ncbi:MAG: DUF6445 family protein [Rubrivivax sp.]